MLTGFTVRSLPEAVKSVRGMGFHIRDPKGMLFTREQRAQRATGLLGAAFSLALLASGWELDAHPGEFHFQRGAEQLHPFQIVQNLAEGKLMGEAWLERARTLGIEDLRLDTV